MDAEDGKEVQSTLFYDATACALAVIQSEAVFDAEEEDYDRDAAFPYIHGKELVDVLNYLEDIAARGGVDAAMLYIG